MKLIGGIYLLKGPARRICLQRGLWRKQKTKQKKTKKKITNSYERSGTKFYAVWTCNFTHIPSRKSPSLPVTFSGVQSPAFAPWSEGGATTFLSNPEAFIKALHLQKKNSKSLSEKGMQQYFIPSSSNWRIPQKSRESISGSHWLWSFYCHSTFPAVI